MPVWVMVEERRQAVCVCAFRCRGMPLVVVRVERRGVRGWVCVCVGAGDGGCCSWLLLLVVLVLVLQHFPVADADARPPASLPLHLPVSFSSSSSSSSSVFPPFSSPSFSSPPSPGKKYVNPSNPFNIGPTPKLASLPPPFLVASSILKIKERATSVSRRPKDASCVMPTHIPSRACLMES